MDFRNYNEALREVGLDIKEGADFVMVKPGMPYLDIIGIIKQNYKIPVFSYQVSGEYSMIMNAIKNKTLNENAIYESLISLKRAGSSAIITYFSLDIAKQLKSSQEKQFSKANLDLGKYKLFGKKNLLTNKFLVKDKAKLIVLFE